MTDEGINYNTVRIDTTKCERCYECVKGCMNNALTIDKGIFVHNPYECAYCEWCMDCCLNDAITIMEM